MPSNYVYRKRSASGSYASNRPYKRARRPYNLLRRRIRRYGGGRRGPELKWFDQSVALEAMSATGTVWPSLNLVTVGNGQNQMLGRKIVIKSVQGRVIFDKPLSTNAVVANVNTEQDCRFALIVDTQCNGSTVTTADIYQNTGLLAHKRMDTGQRFRILKEWIFNLNSQVSFVTDTSGTTSAYTVGANGKYIKFYKKLNVVVDFADEASPGTRAISEVRTNNLFLIGWSNAGTVTASFITRIRFDDQ